MPVRHRTILSSKKTHFDGTLTAFWSHGWNSLVWFLKTVYAWLTVGKVSGIQQMGDWLWDSGSLHQPLLRRLWFSLNECGNEKSPHVYPSVKFNMVGIKTVFLEMSTLFYVGLLKVWGKEMSFVGWIIVIIAVTSSVVQAWVWQVESGGMSQSLSKWTQNSFWPYDDDDLCTAWGVLLPRIPLIDCLLSWIQHSFLSSVA